MQKFPDQSRFVTTCVRQLEDAGIKAAAAFVATRLEISRSGFSKWQNGENQMPPEKRRILEKLVAALADREPDSKPGNGHQRPRHV